MSLPKLSLFLCLVLSISVMAQDPDRPPQVIVNPDQITINPNQAEVVAPAPAEVVEPAPAEVVEPAPAPAEVVEPAPADNTDNTDNSDDLPPCARGRRRGTTGRIFPTNYPGSYYHIGLDDLPAPNANASVERAPEILAPPEDGTLNVPRGFIVNLFADALDQPKWLAATPNGDILVTETSLNQIRLLRDTDGDGVADFNEIFASAENGVNSPFGLTFSEGFFYLANTAEVRRYPYQAGDDSISGTGERIIDLPATADEAHWTRNIRVSPDGASLFITVGSLENVAEEEEPRATILIANLDGTDVRTFGSGLRNPNGLDFHPVTGELYVNVIERDGLGDDAVPDYMTRVEEGQFFGWPYAYLSSDNLDPRMVDENGESINPERALQTATPDVLFQSHSTPMGLQFYNGDTFPDTYSYGAFAAMEGSWNREEPAGFKIVDIPFDEYCRPEGGYEDFLTGFVADASIPSVWGRPVGLQVAQDGSLLFADETGGRIYRVQYEYD